MVLGIVPLGDPVDDSPAPDRPVRDITVRERDAGILGELSRVALRHGLGREPRMSAHWSSVLGKLVPLSVPNSVARNPERPRQE